MGAEGYARDALRIGDVHACLVCVAQTNNEGSGLEVFRKGGVEEATSTSEADYCVLLHDGDSQDSSGLDGCVRSQRAIQLIFVSS